MPLDSDSQPVRLAAADRLFRSILAQVSLDLQQRYFEAERQVSDVQTSLEELDISSLELEPAGELLGLPVFRVKNPAEAVFPHQYMDALNKLAKVRNEVQTEYRRMQECTT